MSLYLPNKRLLILSESPGSLLDYGKIKINYPVKKYTT